MKRANVKNPMKRPFWSLRRCQFCQTEQRFNLEEPWLHCDACQRCIICQRTKEDRCGECTGWEIVNRGTDGNIKFVKVKEGKSW